MQDQDEIPDETRRVDQNASRRVEKPHVRRFNSKAASPNQANLNVALSTQLAHEHVLWTGNACTCKILYIAGSKAVVKSMYNPLSH